MRPCARVEQPTPLETGWQTDRQSGRRADYHWPFDPPDRFDDWQFEEDVHTIRRMIQSLQRRPPSDDPFPRVKRCESPKQTSAPHPMPRQTARPASSSELRDLKRLAVAAMVSSGLSLLSLGLLLLVLSYATTYAELWKLGLPLTLLGQTALFLGLMRARTKQVKRNESRDDQVAELRDPAEALAHRPAPDAAILRYDLRAAPVQALAHLQRQLDQLADRIHRETC